MEDWYVKVPEEEQKKRKLQAEEKSFREKLPTVFREVLVLCLFVTILYCIGIFVVRVATVDGEEYNLQKLIKYVFSSKNGAGIVYCLMFFVNLLLLAVAFIVSLSARKNIGRYISVKKNTIICGLFDIALLISFAQLIICSKVFSLSGGGLSATVLTAILVVATIAINAIAENVKRKFNKYNKGNN